MPTLLGNLRGREVRGRRLAIAGALGLLLLASPVLPSHADVPTPQTADGHPWVGPDGRLLPFRNDQEVVDFLRTALISESEKIEQGINRPEKLLLEKDGVAAHAVFRSVDRELSAKARSRWRHPLPFRDNHGFEVAAFRLSRLLGLRLVPEAVVRRHGAVEGSVQIWVEGAIDERTRRERELIPPDPLRWRYQMDSMAVFDALIQNDDRNLGNLLIDAQWNVWLIDHTRSFTSDTRIRQPGRLLHLSRTLWSRLRTIEEREVRQALAPYLTPRELKALFCRFAKVVAHFEELIESQGEERVLFSEEYRKLVKAPFGSVGGSVGAGA